MRRVQRSARLTMRRWNRRSGRGGGVESAAMNQAGRMCLLLVVSIVGAMCVLGHDRAHGGGGGFDAQNVRAE